MQIAKSTVTEKWGSALDAGYVVVPNVLLLKQHDLGLSDSEVLVLLHVFMAWREKDKLPFPSPATLAKRIGVNPRTVQRHLAAIADKGLMVRIKDGEDGIRKYDPTALVTKLKALAPHLAMHKHPVEDAARI
ncbi:MAG: helix-turn-helix domain-containing protein [Herminiimonas sp.]|uniref:helix-turn-helix domain-containing protein n=1 Tax=Herminiimonas sp. TaxID=1926289 RepID=UPI002727E011|nr:helix-turn-helix domain-containing protein [Herminiimonas sp.]MDO9419966.1 helix-turn-helix domain-containing protein [Herminiimonas sp.]